MINDTQESIQLLNTAIIKSKEKGLDIGFEERLAETCNSPSIDALTIAIHQLAESENISFDQAAIQIVETVRDLDKIWNDYIMMEGLGKLKSLLKDRT